MKPSEAYLTPYMEGVKGLTQRQVYDDVYPVWTYSAAAVAVLAFLFTDVYGYRATVRTEGFAYLATRVLLLWGEGVLSMQVMQGVYAVATSTEIGYLAYVFAISRDDNYQKVASAAKASILVAETLASGIAQFAVSAYGDSSFTALNYISLCSVAAGCVVAITLPPVQPALHNAGASINSERVASEGIAASTKPPVHSMLARSSWADFQQFYAVWPNLRWSLWAAAGLCGLFQVENYIQTLWEAATHGKSEWNGLVGIGAMALSVATTLSPAFLPSDCVVFTRPELVLALLSTACGMLLVAMGVSANPLVCYGGYILFKGCFMFTSAIAAAQIAAGAVKTLPHATMRFGMVYGFNTVVALALEAALQFSVGPHGAGLNITQQFKVYGGFFVALGATFVAARLFGCTVITVAKHDRASDLRRVLLTTDVAT